MSQKVKKAISITLTVVLIATMCGIVASFTDLFGRRSNNDVNDDTCKHKLVSVPGQEPTCLEDGWSDYNYCTKCSYIDKEIISATGHSLRFDYVESDPIISCHNCSNSFAPDTYYALDGTDHDGLFAKGTNSVNFTVASGTQLPAIVDGHYEYIKNASHISTSQCQMWLPAEATGITGFSSDNNAVGVLSFKVNTNVDELFEMKLVEGHSSNRWGAEWCITNSVFKIAPYVDENGYQNYVISGVQGVALKTITVEAPSYTDWLDIQIGILLDAVTDNIILHYYIGGEHIATESAVLTTQDNSITSLYINARTKAVDTGYMIDDLVFGFTENGEWQFN